VCRAYRFMPTSSPLFYPVTVDIDAITCSKIDFAEAVRAEGIDLNPHYKYVVCEWPYIRPYLADDFDTPNARSIRDRSFNLYRNEKYGEQESKDCVKAIVKVEKHFKAG
jgi:perosamine synthetase